MRIEKNCAGLPSRYRLGFLLLLCAGVPVIVFGQNDRPIRLFMDLGIDELHAIAEPRPGLTVVAHTCGVLRTDNGGVDWTLHNFPDCCGVSDMKFCGNIRIAVEGCRIWRSVDTGKTWDRVYKDGGLAVEFVDSSTVIVVGYQRDCFRSTDAGLHWMRMSRLTGFHLNGLDFYDAGQGLAVSTSGYVNRTFNGGKDWTDTLSAFQGYPERDFPYLTGLACIDNNTCLTVSADGYIFRSVDNGLNWECVLHDTSGLNGIAFVDAYRGVVVGDSGVILSTLDGGFTWTKESYDWRFNLRRALFINRSEALIVGNECIIVRKRFDR